MQERPVIGAYVSVDVRSGHAELPMKSLSLVS